LINAISSSLRAQRRSKKEHPAQPQSGIKVKNDFFMQIESEALFADFSRMPYS